MLEKKSRNSKFFTAKTIETKTSRRKTKIKLPRDYALNVTTYLLSVNTFV